MHTFTTHESSARHEQYRGAFCVRTSAFNNAVTTVRHALVVCLLFVDVLALLSRLIILPGTELAGIPAA